MLHGFTTGWPNHFNNTTVSITRDTTLRCSELCSLVQAGIKLADFIQPHTWRNLYIAIPLENKAYVADRLDRWITLYFVVGTIANKFQPNLYFFSSWNEIMTFANYQCMSTNLFFSVPRCCIWVAIASIDWTVSVINLQKQSTKS